MISKPMWSLNTGKFYMECIIVVTDNDFILTHVCLIQVVF